MPEEEKDLSESLDRIVDLFEELVKQWNKLVQMQRENIAAYDKLVNGEYLKGCGENENNK